MTNLLVESGHTVRGTIAIGVIILRRVGVLIAIALIAVALLLLLLIARVSSPAFAVSRCRRSILGSYRRIPLLGWVLLLRLLRRVRLLLGRVRLVAIIAGATSETGLNDGYSRNHGGTHP